MQKYKYVLFDWNGTLIDDLQMNIDLENFMLKKRGLSLLESRDFYLENFGFPIKDFYELVGFDFEKEDYNDICDEYAAQYRARIESAKLFPDVVPILEKLKAAGVSMAIISATKQDVLREQVQWYGISPYFDEILGTNDLKGTSKVNTAKQWFSKNHVNSNEVVFVGDTTHDVETASAIGCECFLVSRGHNSEGRLRKTGCEVFDSLEALAERLL